MHADSRKSPHRVQRNLYLDAHHVTELERLAREQDRSVSAVVRELVRTHLAQQSPEER